MLSIPQLSRCASSLSCQVFRRQRPLWHKCSTCSNSLPLRYHHGRPLSTYAVRDDHGLIDLARVEVDFVVPSQGWLNSCHSAAVRHQVSMSLRFIYGRSCGPSFFSYISQLAGLSRSVCSFISFLSKRGWFVPIGVTVFHICNFRSTPS